MISVSHHQQPQRHTGTERQALVCRIRLESLRYYNSTDAQPVGMMSPWLLLLFRRSAENSIAWPLHLISDKATPAACDSSEDARTLNQRCYPHTGNGGHSWCLSHSLSLSVGIFIQDEAQDHGRSALQGAHYHSNVIYLLLQMVIKNE